MTLGHVAVFTKDMDKSITFYDPLGGRQGLRRVLDLGEGRSKDLAHMVFDGEATVELVCPSHEDMFITETGVCEHFCFNVDNVDETVKELKANGIDSFVTEEPTNADIFGGIRIIFLTGPNGELIELFQDHQ